VLNAALEYRALNMGVYGVTTPLLKPWTSRPGMIEIVLELFHRSAAAVEAPRELAADARGGKAAPLAQLPVLASALYAAIHERLDWLGRSVIILMCCMRTGLIPQIAHSSPKTRRLRGTGMISRSASASCDPKC
jgi:hypothetical protein